MKDIDIELKILEVAKKEFMEQGYMNASMRVIAEKSGCTTGMLYSRFADKDKIFSSLVKEGADKLLNGFKNKLDIFGNSTPKEQIASMHSFSEQGMEEIMDIIYEYFESFKLIVCHGFGSSYEHYVDSLVDMDVESSIKFMNVLKAQGYQLKIIRADLCHMLASSLLNGIFETVAHDFDKNDAIEYVNSLQDFFAAGWDRLLGLKYDKES